MSPPKTISVNPSSSPAIIPVAEPSSHSLYDALSLSIAATASRPFLRTITSIIMRGGTILMTCYCEISFSATSYNNFIARRQQDTIVSEMVDATVSIVKTRDEIVRAAREGNIELIALLLREAHIPVRQEGTGSSSILNGLCSIGITPLYMATLKGNVETVQFLLENGASPTFPTGKGRTPLFAAILSASMATLNLLVDAGASLEGDTGGELLFEATRRGRADIAHWLVESAGVSVQFMSPTTGMTPLFAAASFGDIELATKFLANGATINARTLKGQTPLFVASLLGHIDMVRFLIENGAHVDLTTANGETALFAAAGWGHLNVVRELIRSGAIIDNQNLRGETPLFVAISRGSAAVVAYLITECGAALDLRTANGDTLLSIAKSSRQPEIVKIIQDHFVAAK